MPTESDTTKQAFADATTLAEAIRHGQTSASAAMEASLDQARDDPNGAICHLDVKMGLAAAAAIDAELAAGNPLVRNAPFCGVPFLAKDLGNAACGLPVYAGSKAMAARVEPATQDSVSFQRFRSAGLLPFGVTTTPEFGLSLTSEPAGGPVARNPWNPAYSPGGSSGGAAVAVASGIVAMAHATDAAGSIRVPAACCGLVGLKPSRGLTTNAPDFGNQLMGIAAELALTRSVRDARSALLALSGNSMSQAATSTGELALSGVSVKGLRIGLVDTAPTGIGAAQVNALRSAADMLRQHGHELIDLDPKTLDHIADEAQQIVQTILCVGQAALLDAMNIGNDEVSALVAAVADRGRKLKASDLFNVDLRAARLAYECAGLFETVDLIAMPMLSGAAPALGSMPMDNDDVDGLWARMAHIAPRASLANATGIPALSMPRGLDASGLPLSLQFIGPVGSDLQMLHIAQQLENDAPWPFLAPPAGVPQ